MTELNKTFVILVNENDQVIGKMEKMEAHEKALLHRAISVFVLNSKGEWLLQRRALNKYHSSGLWTNTTCSHPYPDESTHAAAERRLLEEMGLTCELKEIFTFIYKEKLDNNLSEYELDHVFVGFSDDLPQINKTEVMEWRYISFDQICSEIETNPSKYTVWFYKIFSKVNDYLKNK